jgi:hypothetical protein
MGVATILSGPAERFEVVHVPDANLRRYLRLAD